MTELEFRANCKEPGYMIRVNAKDHTAYGGFLWPEHGYVSAPDWEPTIDCGNGLHGLLNGEGDMLSSFDDETDIMKVCLIDVSKTIDLSAKIKVPEAFVLFSGDKIDAWAFLHKLVGNRKMYYATLTGGDRSTLTGGYGSTLTGGYGSTLTGGYGSTLTGGDRSTLTGGGYSTLTGGDRSTLTGGDYSTLTGGDRSTLTGGDYSTLTGGYRSTLTGGHGSTLTGGYGSTLTGGDYSTLTGGDYSTLTGGDYSTLTGGHGSTLTWRYWDRKYTRVHTIYVGENGIKENTPYHGEYVAGQFVVTEVEK